MTRSNSLQVFRDRTSSLEARIVSAIGAVGPRNVAQIARLTGAHQETIRYKIKRQFVDKGFRFQADVDYRRFGLVLYWGRFVVSPQYYGSPTRLFRSLNDAAYLIHFSKILPQGHFMALFSLPEGMVGELTGFLENLRQRKVFSEFTLSRVMAQRHKTMDPRFFNFRKNRWEVDWDQVRKLRPLPLEEEARKPRVQADYTDMLTVKELQKDARQHIAEIARKLKLNAKMLEYHYRTHVMKGGLVPSFRVRWTRDTDEPRLRSMVTVKLTFEGLGEEQLKAVQSVVNRIPFLLVEDLVEPATYAANLAIPLGDLVPTMNHINRELQYLGRSFDMGYLSIEDSENYTIPYHMFSKGKWRFESKKAESAVLSGLKAVVEK